MIFIAVVGSAMVRLGRANGGLAWTLAWVSLYVSGGAQTLARLVPALGPLYPAFGTLFAALLVFGAFRFARHKPPSGFVPLVVGVMALRALAQPFLSEAMTQAVGATVLTAGAAVATYYALRAAREPGASGWEAVLAASLPLVGITSIVYAIGRIQGDPPERGAFLWLVTGFLVSGIQTVTLIGRAKKRAEEGRATLAAVVDAVPIGLVLIDPMGRIGALNRVLSQQLELGAPSDWVGASVQRLVDRFRGVLAPGQLPEGELLGEAATADDRGLGEREVLLADGRVFFVHVRPVSDIDGRVIGQLGFVRDMTQERSLATELRQARQLETLGSLAGGVAHDFNNQLTTILGNASLLRDGMRGDEHQNEALSDLERAALHCAAVTRDLLDFARKSPRSPVAVDLPIFFRDLRPRLEPHLPHGVRLSVEVEPTTPAILADRTQLERVVTNLVLNARDAVAPHGSIDLRASAGLGGDRSHVEIAVSDDGPGIPPEVRERIFDPFFSTKEVGEGTGLGLAIVHGVVTSHAGSVSCETRVNSGAVFTTTWPLAEADPITRTPPSKSPGARHQGETLLVVDDDPAVLRFMRAVLCAAGYEVMGARSGEEAVALFGGDAGKVALAVVDQRMPGMTGTETAHALRRGRPDLPVLLISGHRAEAAAEVSSPRQALQKPFRAEDLLRSVDELLTARGGTER